MKMCKHCINGYCYNRVLIGVDLCWLTLGQECGHKEVDNIG